MKISLYIDEDAMSRALIRGLRARGIDVKTVSEANRIGLSDLEQLLFAHKERRTILTSNISDFCTIHSEFMKSGKDHSGIILMPQQKYSIGEQIRRLATLITAQTSLEIKNQILFISDWG